MLMRVLAVPMTDDGRGPGHGRSGSRPPVAAPGRGEAARWSILPLRKWGSLTPRTADLRPKGGPATQVGRAATSQSGGAETMSFPPVSTRQLKIVLRLTKAEETEAEGGAQLTQ